MRFLAWLHDLERFGMKLGLENITTLLERLGNPHHSFKSVHVGGTNGKGSVTAMISTVLREAGYRAGMYTSPHLVRFNERIQVNGECISDEDLDRLAAQLKPHVDELRCTYFEAATALAFLYFREKKVDVAVCEVGLGGRLDATNVLTPEVSVITNVGIEHTEHLGETIEKIALEKAGIIKPGVPIVTAATGHALDVIRRIAAERNAPLVIAQESPYPTNLTGSFQRANAGVAVSALSVLRTNMAISDAAIRSGLMNVRWPGRMDFVEPTILIDAAHNPDGVQALIGEIKTLKYKRLILIFGALRDKDYAAMIRSLEPHADKIILSRPQSDRAADPHEIAKLLQKKALVIPDVRDAVAKGKEMAEPGDLLLVTGSIYLIGKAYEALEVTIFC